MHVFLTLRATTKWFGGVQRSLSRCSTTSVCYGAPWSSISATLLC